MKFKLILASIAIAGLSGCISIKSYVDPQYATLSYTDVNIPANTTFDLTTEFLRDGKPNKRAAAEIEKIAAKVFTKAGITNAPEGAKLKITCNNIADMGAAAAKGFGTGLTLGLAGSTVTDGYQFTFEMEQGGSTVTKTYDHAIHSTVGNAEAPIANVEAVTTIVAFEEVFEDVMLSFLKDMSESNMIAWNGQTVNLAP